MTVAVTDLVSVIQMPAETPDEVTDAATGVLDHYRANLDGLDPRIETAAQDFATVLTDVANDVSEAGEDMSARATLLTTSAAKLQEAAYQVENACVEAAEQDVD